MVNPISSTETFISKAKAKHGDKYSYNKSIYIDSQTKLSILCISCKKYFLQTPNNHLKGCGCPTCYEKERGNLKLNSFKEKFVELAQIAHGIGRYNYLRSEYKGTHEPLLIKCSVCDNEFWQKPSLHLRKDKPCGCPKCALNKNLDKELLEKHFPKKVPEPVKPEPPINKRLVAFLSKAKEVHGDKYDYSNITEIKNNREKVDIICKKCNVLFTMMVTNHLHAEQGCRKCRDENNAKRNKVVLDENKELFESKAKEVHGDKYDYNKAVYTGTNNKVNIKCNKCNKSFFKSPYNHITLKQGCPKCSMPESKLEETVRKILEDSNAVYEQGRRSILENKRLELDFYIPSHNLAIECHGNYWHSEIILDHMKAMKHMKEKFDQCNAQGIQLMQFYKDEIKNKPELIKSMIQYKLGIGKKLYGRNTEVFTFKKNDLSKEDIESIKEFFNTNHIQGISAYNSGSILLDKKTDEIVSVMLFNNIVSNRGIKAKDNEVELVRFCSNCIVVGGASKLLVNYLEHNTNVKKVVSYSDNRISLGNLYEMLSFKKTNEINPSYYYVHKSTEGSLIRLHKTYFKKANQKIKFENYNEELTEYENCANNDYYRLWDAGKVKWELVL